MQHHGRVEEHRRERVGGARVHDAGVVWSHRYAKSILLQAYLDCLNKVWHSKQRDESSTPRIQTQLVKMLTSKTGIADYREAYEFCVDLWDELSLALCESQGSSLVPPSRDELCQMQGSGAMIRLALLADFYRYLKEDLALNEEESSKKLCAIRAETFEIITASRLDARPVLHKITVIPVPTGHLTGLDSSIRDSLVRPTEPMGGYAAPAQIPNTARDSSPQKAKGGQEQTGSPLGGRLNSDVTGDKTKREGKKQKKSNKDTDRGKLPSCTGVVQTEREKKQTKTTKMKKKKRDNTKSEQGRIEMAEGEMRTLACGHG
ncbi:hypothetical protein D5F01_LYC20797 [Larimichthys crocea]|uniref:Uncharacterized protein n=1 Tax=Larimichthys crocea TaxID=215358 RepID=A0A6G0HMD4_LARCR|nr:hypothetical protein D5F01_LYC20797 [Larimichthys crocea]